MDFRTIEEKWQKKWERSKIFDSEPKRKKKYYMLFAYPTVSGTLHIGHARSYVIPDSIARFKRMTGFNVFFPLGFHATGIDILVILEEIKKDLRNAKKYGIPSEDAIKFKRVSNVKNYLEKKMITDFKKFGLSLDFRPVVSSIDPPYNKFIQWQFRKLKKLNYLVKRDYRLAWCPKCNHPISLDPAEMDIKEWKGSQIKDYIIIKFKMKKIVIPAATLRPETVFGVTNIWINPDAKYVRAKVDGEKWIISEETVKKLEDLEKKVKILGEFAGKELLGEKVKNPATKELVPILSGEFVDPDEATGIVMSVPAHDTFDYIHLKKVAPDIKPIQVVKTRGYGAAPAGEMIKKYGIKYSGDPKLEDATKELYKIEYNGKMLKSISKFGGMPVSRAKNEVGNWLRRIKKSDMIYELSIKPVHCRCGTEIIIKVVKNQWFIDYGNIKWKEMVKKHIKRMNTYPPDYKTELLSSIIDWLEVRPCVRKRGLGTEFPFEKGWTIEAISDSTIYMAFFIVTKYLNSKRIKIKDLTDEFFNYVFLGKGKAKKQIWKDIRKEFEYWYPLNLNTIGKEHKAVHLPFFIFNHVAIFPQKFWPKGIFVNWHLIAYGKKLSKHLGNVVFWGDAIDIYGADTVRFYLLHGSNQWNDFNWRNEDCEAYGRHLQNFYNIIDEIIKSKRKKRTPIDKWLASKMNRAIKDVTNAMEKNEIRKAIDSAFFSLLNDIYWYKKRTETYNINIIPIWLKLLSPFIPHTCEDLWKKTGNKGFISIEKWPKYDAKKINLRIEVGEDLIRKTLGDINEIKKLSRIENPVKITIFTAPQWKYEVYNYVMEDKKLKYILSRKKFKKISKHISKYYKKLQKKKPLEELFLTATNEFKLFKYAKEFFEKEFNCKIEVIHSIKSEHPKALAAEPCKPGILIE